uniref:Uncharacterized protein n=1 Tax=Timema bartmani TaxID=61472 RepID=A0A7R9FBK7_9NEOP|nr:unnamed protein product [Timema bartmani]
MSPTGLVRTLVTLPGSLGSSLCPIWSNSRVGGLPKVKEGFGNQINLCWDRGLNTGPPAQRSDTLPLDHQQDLHCGPVVRVPVYRSQSARVRTPVPLRVICEPGDLERGQLSLARTNESILE